MYSIKAKLGHVIAGLLTVLIAPIIPLLSFLSVILFILYEIWESIKIHDTGYLELREFIYGFYLGLIVILLIYT